MKNSLDVKLKQSPKDTSAEHPTECGEAGHGERVGILAGSGNFPLMVARDARASGYEPVVCAHIGETSEQVKEVASSLTWVKLGQLGKVISFFKSEGCQKIIFAGGISRVRLLGGVSLDFRGASLIARIRTTKDDIVMRGLAEELAKDGLEVVSCTSFCKQSLVSGGQLTKSKPQGDEVSDIEVGREVLKATSPHHIGQLVVVRRGVVVAVEAVEGSDEAITRGGQLAGPGSVVIKCAKPDQDMRFDVPTVGLKTLEVMHSVKARVLALEEGRVLLLDKEKVIEFASKKGISIVGLPQLLSSS